MSTPNINRLMDVEMNVTVRFGKTEMPLKDIVHFGVGSMIELNRTVDDPVELLVNNYPFARGEVVVIDGYYGVRVTEINSAEERTQSFFPTMAPDDNDGVGSAVAEFEAALAAEPDEPALEAEPAAATDEETAASDDEAFEEETEEIADTTEEE